MISQLLQQTFVLISLLVFSGGVSAAGTKEQMAQFPGVKTAIEELVLANHILYDQNAVDGYGVGVPHECFSGGGRADF